MLCEAYMLFVVNHCVFTTHMKFSTLKKYNELIKENKIVTNFTIISQHLSINLVNFWVISF